MNLARGGMILVLAAALFASRQGTATAAEADSPLVLGSDLEIEALEEGLWLYRAGTVLESFGRVTSNGLIVAGSDGVWLIDTPWNDEQTAVLLDWIEAHLGRPRGLVSTHFHADRMGGIAEAHRRGLDTWGHSETARLGVAAGLEAPRHTFDSVQELSTGSEVFEIFYPGAGHTLDNTVVWFPDRKLLFGGCLVKSAGSKSAGFVGDAVLDAWPGSLEVVKERFSDARVVVPGHGASGTLGLLTHTAVLVGNASEAEARRVDKQD